MTMRRTMGFALLAGFMLAAAACVNNGTTIAIVPYPPVPAGIDNVQPADPVTANNIHASQRWPNPVLLVHPDGIEMVGSDLSGRGPHLSVAQVEKALNELPIGAWPWGRTVEVREDGLTSGPEQAAMVSALKIMLDAHHVLVFW